MASGTTGCPCQGYWLFKVTPRGQPSGQSPVENGRGRRGDEGSRGKGLTGWECQRGEEKVLLRFGVFLGTSGQAMLFRKADLLTTSGQRTEV